MHCGIENINKPWLGRSTTRNLGASRIKHQNFTLLQKIWSHPCYYSLLDMSSCTNSPLNLEVIIPGMFYRGKNKLACWKPHENFWNDGSNNTVGSVTQYLSTELHVTVTNLSWDFGHDMPCMGRRIDVNNEGGLDSRPSSLYWQIEPGVSLA